jgi:arylamine N-acetyltransferase
LTIAVDEILDDLELPRAEPGRGYLERLFLRFNERVPFENASKIVRHAAVSDPAAKPRDPETFWRDRIEAGSGGTCFERVAAFDALLRELRFSARLAFGRVRKDDDHSALLVELSGEQWICDAGFPLPALLPARPGRVETGVGALVVTDTDRGWRIDFDGGVPEGIRGIDVFRDPVPAERFQRRWRESFEPGANFLSDVVLHRLLENRRVSFVRGAIRIDDLHSRTHLPLPAPRAPALEALFGMDAEILEAAFAIAGDPDPDPASATIDVYLESPAPAAAAYDAIATPEGYARLLEGVADVSTERTGPSTWRSRLSAPGADPGAAIEEEVRAQPDSHTLGVTRKTGESRFAVEDRDGQTWLVRRAILQGERSELLRNDSLRGRLAGALAVDLLAWARLVGSSRR